MGKIILLILAVAVGLFAQTKKVLIIESYHKEFGWDASYLDGIKSELGTDYEIKRYQMDTKRVPKDEYQSRADRAWKMYQMEEPDLVILGDDNALKFLGNKFHETKTPVVFLGINNNPRRYIQLRKNITGILERPLLKKSIVTIKEVVPDTKKVLVMFDDSTTSQVILDEVFKGKKSLKIAGIHTDLKLIGSFDEWKKTVGESKGQYDAIAIGLYFTLKDAQGDSVPGNDVLTWTTQNSAIPPFAFWDFAVGKGKAIGGLVLYGKTQGIAAAQIAKEVLEGKEISKILPKTGEKGRYYFSKSGLEKYSLTLPSHIAGGIEYSD